MGTVRTQFEIFKSGTLWHNPAWTPTNKKCAGFADANPGEAASLDAYVGALDADPTAAKMPTLATATGRGLAGTFAALAARIAPAPVPPDPPEPAPTGIYWGARPDGEVYGVGDPPWNMEAWNRFEANAGKRMSIFHFGQPQWWVRPSFDRAAHDAIVARGAYPLVSYGDSVDDLAAVARGDHDADIAALADAYKAWGQPVLLRLWWEMNQYGSSWFVWAVPAKVSAATYVAAWRRYVSIFRSRGAKNVSFVWCPNFVRTDTTRVQQIRDCFPGEDVVDWTGIDGYNAFAPSASFATLYKLTYDTVAALTSKPMILAEFASRDAQAFAAGVKGQWTLAALAAVKSYPLLRAVVWFNWNILEGGVHKDWPIESSADATAKFAAAIADPYFLPGPRPIAAGPVPIP